MEKDLLRYHPNVVRKELLRSLASDQEQQPISLLKPDFLTQYPSGKSTRRGFSTSMEFSRTVLRQSVQTDRCAFEDDFFIEKLVRILLVRAIRKRADWDVILEVVDLTLQYFESHPSTGKEITNDVRDVRHLVAIDYTRKPRLFDQQLRKSLPHPIFDTANMDELTNWAPFLSTGVVALRRYALLRLCYQESKALILMMMPILRKPKES
jgi:hypothetical protein